MDRDRVEESEPFLSPENESTTSQHNEKTAERKPNNITAISTHRYSFTTIILSTIAFISLLTNAYLSLKIYKPSNEAQNHDMHKFQTPYSPATPHVKYELKHIDAHDYKDPFNGPPTDAFDEAWHGLLHPTMIRVTPEEMRRAGKQSIRLDEPDRDTVSYLGYLEIYHQLHCVKRIAQGRWPERYPDLVAQGKLSDGHFNHCLQVIRKGIMCNGDTTLNTWTWDPANRTRTLSVPSRQRKCIDWEMMDSWARTRATGPDYELMAFETDGYFGPDL